MRNDVQLDGEGMIRNMKYRNRHESRKLALLPFDQDLKRKLIVRHLPEDPAVARVYVQGAPEEVMNLCNFTHNVNDPENPSPKNRQLVDFLISNVDMMATDGLKVFSLAYKDFLVEDLNKIKKNFGEESQKFRQLLEQDLIYLCTFGFTDPLREQVVSAINEIQTGPSKQVVAQQVDQSGE